MRFLKIFFYKKESNFNCNCRKSVSFGSDLGGCGGGSGANSGVPGDASSASDETITGDTANSDTSGNSLTVWCWDPQFNIPAMQEAADIYARDYDEGFTVTIVPMLTDDCETGLITAATSGDFSTLPDIILMQDNSYQKYVYAYPEAFTDLTESGIDFSNFPEGKLSYSVVDGRNYGVPFDNGTTVGAWRTDYLEEAGYTIDDLTDITWERFIEIGKDVKDKTGHFMISSQSNSPDLIMEMLHSAGASLYNEDGSANIAGNSALIECINIYQEMVESGVLYEVNSWDEYVSSITTGQVVGTVNGCWICASIMAVDDMAGLWGITNMPALVTTPGATNYSVNGGSSWYITCNCKNMELAEDFLAKTFAGSVELFDNILPTTAAIATYIPAGDSDVYNEPQDFWNGDAIYAKIVDFSSKVPSNNSSPIYYDGRDYVGTAIQDIMNGADIDSELQIAQDSTDADAHALGLY
ncbi:MAG: extracellular solute-binding protein [Clostridiales bacterium]|nr:extracellular solute-binding protein [Clostridiales bacterium]